MSKQQLALEGYNHNRLKVYTTEEIDHCERSKAIKRYVDAGLARSENSGTAYKSRLQAFSQFIFLKMRKKDVDQFVVELQTGKHDPYDFLLDFLTFLRTSRTGKNKLSANVINSIIRTTKKFFRFSKVKMDNEEFKERVQLLRKERPTKKGIEKGDVSALLNACKDIRLKTATLGFAATGPRPIELCAVRNCDIDFLAKNPTITFRAEFSKMREARTRPITKEFANQCRIWYTWKYRTRRTTFYDAKGKKFNHKVITPEQKPDDLFFAHIHYHNEVTPKGIYSALQRESGDLIDLVHGQKASRNAANGKARDVSLKVFRDFVKSTISDAGHSDYSEWFIGHGGSTYYQKSDKERMEVFRKIEPYITYLDISALEARHVDMESRIEAIQDRYEVKLKVMDERMKILDLIHEDPEVMTAVQKAIDRLKKN